MRPAKWAIISLRGLGAWSVFSLAGWWLAEPLGNLLLPLIELVLHGMATDFSPALTLVEQDHDYLIRLSAWVLHPIAIGPGRTIPATANLTAGIHLLHTLVPAIILLSIVSAWPVHHVGERLALLSAGVFLSVIMIAAIAPFCLLGHLEIYCQELAQQAGVARPEPWTVSWMIFTEMGGRWLLPIGAALICIQAHRHWTAPRRSPD